MISCKHCAKLIRGDQIYDHYAKVHRDVLAALAKKPIYKRPKELPRAAPLTPPSKDREAALSEWSHLMDGRRMGTVTRTCATCGRPAVYNSNGCSVHDPK